MRQIGKIVVVRLPETVKSKGHADLAIQHQLLPGWRRIQKFLKLRRAQTTPQRSFEYLD